VNLSVEAIDTGPSTRSAVATFTPTSFQMPVAAVRLFGGPEEQTIYENPSKGPIEFKRNSREPAISANKEAAVGVYDSMEVEVGAPGDDRYVIVAGCANLATDVMASETHCTRSDVSQSSLDGGPEPVKVRSANQIDAVLTDPIEVTADSSVELTLYYDLTQAVTFLNEPGPPPDDPGFGRLGFANGTTIEVKYPPMFAFIGKPPPAEIYQLELTSDPDPNVEPILVNYYYPSDRWHVRMWAFFDDAGQPLVRRDVWVIDEGADGAGLVSMFGNAAKMESNGDGSYTIYEPNPDPAFQSWELPSFKRETHDGTANWTTPQGNKAIGYTVTRLQ
jgi:hypothetical protein